MEGDDDELEDSDCLPRLHTKCPFYSRAASISLSASSFAAFIRGRCLFAEIRYVICHSLRSMAAPLCDKKCLL